MKNWERFYMKKITKQILKKLLPQSLKNKLKVAISKYPYAFHPSFLLSRKKNQANLAGITSGEYRGIIIFPPTIDWHMPLFQRPQQLAQAFAELGYLVFYTTNNLRFDQVKGFEKIKENLYLTNQMHLLRKTKNPILFISWPFNRFYVQRFPGAKFIYDYIDELDVFDTSGKTMTELRHDHEYLAKNADLVVATADRLLLDIKKLNPKKAILAPNGVNLEDFVIPTKPKVPGDMARIVEGGSKIIGYYGAIAEWFDYDLLEDMARKRPEYEFVLVGPYDYDKTLMDHKHLFEVKNIHFLGQKNYYELKNYLYYFDVAIIPFLVNEITKSTSPVKLFEYMAGGKPIVTTAMDECGKYKSVFIAEGVDDFLSKIDLALVAGTKKEYQNLLKAEAGENTWQKRAKVISENL